jgi:hypothetical protein
MNLCYIRAPSHQISWSSDDATSKLAGAPSTYLPNQTYKSLEAHEIGLPMYIAVTTHTMPTVNVPTDNM